MNDHPAGQKGWNSTAFGTDAVMREGGIADRVQPVQLAGDTKSSLVQMPNAAFGKLVALNRSRRSWQTRSSGISC
jgi:hypothetical protein